MLSALPVYCARLRGIVLILVFSCLTPSVLADTDNTDTSAQRARLVELRQTIDELQKTLDKQRDKHHKLRKELRLAEKTISGIVRQLDLVNRKLKHQQKRVDNLSGERRKLRAELAAQRRVLSGQLRAAYAIGRQEYTKLLLNQQDPAVLGRTLVYYDYLNRARSERIDDIRDKVTRLEQVEKDLKQGAIALQATRDEQLAEKRKLERNHARRKKIVDSLARQIRTREQKLGQARADAQQLEALLQGLREALADIPAEAGQRQPFAALRGQLALPVKGRIRARFGSRRKEGKLRWQGVLIGAREGSAVRAVSHGRVAYADWLRGFGLMVIIDHGDGYMSLYGHNQSLFVETGDWVEAGEVIGGAGRSGGQQRSGVYFEIRNNGKPTNPLRWCRRS
ncbi:MAG: peptidoglycan DD-metalloendopeptidase family protein [Granulosicoccaceae bacterium]|jgi:septal ring factor EnvC (AmiA/AmiB activator)